MSPTAKMVLIAFAVVALINVVEGKPIPLIGSILPTGTK